MWAEQVWAPPSHVEAIGGLGVRRCSIAVTWVPRLGGHSAWASCQHQLLACRTRVDITGRLHASKRHRHTDRLTFKKSVWNHGALSGQLDHTYNHICKCIQHRSEWSRRPRAEGNRDNMTHIPNTMGVGSVTSSTVFLWLSEASSLSTCRWKGKLVSLV